MAKYILEKYRPLFRLHEHFRQCILTVHTIKLFTSYSSLPEL